MLDSNLQAFWRDGGTDQDYAAAIISDALDAPPASAREIARLLQLAPVADLAPAFERRVEDELEPLLTSRRARLAQIDQLGNPDTDPQAIAEILGEEADGIDWSSFDPASLARARSGASSRVEGASRLLDQLGWDSLPEQTAAELRAAIEDLRGQSGFASRALLIDPLGHGFVLGLKMAITAEGAVDSDESIDAQMEVQARQALHIAFGSSFSARFSLEWQLPLEGASIGLAMLAAAYVARKDIECDPLAAATGKVEVDGSIAGVEGIAGKLEAAARSGVRRVLLPEANRAEAEAAALPGELELSFAAEVSQVRRMLARVPSGTALGPASKRRVLRGAAKEYGFEAVEEKQIPHGHQFTLSDLGGSASVSLYDSGKIVVGGAGQVKDRVGEMVDKLLPVRQPEPRSPLSLTVKSSERQAALFKALQAIDAENLDPNDHESWRQRLGRGLSAATVVLYSSGKLTLQGNAPAWDEAREVLAEELADLGGGEQLSATPALEIVRARREKNYEEPWIGTDESGKGDFFGPLVSAAVFATPAQAEELKEMGTTDSKKLTDKRVFDLAPRLRATLGRACSVVAINPPRFNSLYREMRARGQNLNTMLAWGHSRSIEDLLETGHKPAYVIVDQFADVRFINSQLLSETRRTELEILQFPKAEMDVAVAAASILAREKFLKWLQKTSGEIGLTLPKGAGPQVLEAGRALVAERGRESLGDYAKLSFKTAAEVLGDGR